MDYISLNIIKYYKEYIFIDYLATATLSSYLWW